MDELDEIRKRKLEELSQQQDSEAQMQQQVNELEQTIKQFLSKEALERYSNLKIAHKEKALQVLAALAQVIQSGQISSPLTDTQFKEILQKLEPKKKEFNIKRK